MPAHLSFFEEVLPIELSSKLPLLKLTVYRSLLGSQTRKYGWFHCWSVLDDTGLSMSQN
jgi:hypothetical protein